MIRTLVVDDDFRVSGIHAAYVAKVPGFEVVGQVSTVEAAEDAVRTLRPELLLLDVYLPDGTGLDLLRRLAAQPPDPSAPHAGRPDAIMITAARDMHSVREAMQLGAIGYLVKPFGFAAFEQRLVAYAELRQRMDALVGAEETDQADVDALFSAGRSAPLPTTPPKGHSAPTLALVRDAVRTARRDLSAAEVAELTGVSRATAQRYLSYLVREGMARLELRYGTTGRPEHRYRAA
ncbi:two-component system response regulator [Streptacidiphilus pinicola]|uniref:Transcriptional regulatory protein n=1 Tax=Streptacidiphilus pinicola TaxID=2219663 RepID=A0A2X0IC88_9ACTN|nr:response regulator [Streptacidiphilus pinicola]RAG82574.1 two-component system response regulator [Streptacidiphilus pinicola]